MGWFDSITGAGSAATGAVTGALSGAFDPKQIAGIAAGAGAGAGAGSGGAMSWMNGSTPITQIGNPQGPGGFPGGGYDRGGGWGDGGGFGGWGGQKPALSPSKYTQQDYDNTVKRYGELINDQDANNRYPVPFSGPNPHDPRNGELDVLTKRLAEMEPYYGQPAHLTDLGNRGSGQPLNQPMGLGRESGPQPFNPGNGQWGRGGMGNGSQIQLMSPDGKEMQGVPMDQVQHWLSKGAQMATGGMR